MPEHVHDYLSTACLHAAIADMAGQRALGRKLHDRCRKVCKFCDAPCRCDCHQREATDGDA